MQYAIVGILVIAFIAFVVLSAKAWHWSNIVFLSLTFLAGLGALIGMSQVLDARRTEMLAAKRTGEALEQIEQQIETVLNGSPAYEYAPDSLRGLSEALDLETAGQGRVWRSGTIEIQDKNRVFKFSGDRIFSQDNPANMQDMLVFVYADQVYEEVVYPVLFVGTMRVIAETPNSLELEPVFIANAEEFDAPSQTWTLFEKSPADQRDAYIRNTDIKLDIDDPNLNQQLTEYRKILVEQFMPASVFNLDLNNPEQARQYENMVDRVMFDGLPLVKIENWIEAQTDRISQRFDPSNEEVFVRYQFQEKSKLTYQVDSTGSIETDGQFTRGGQAVDPALHAGGEIEFQKGDEILVDQLTADGYQRGDEPVTPFPTQEPVTEVTRVYIRQLSDFPFLLKTLQRRTAEYTAEIARIAENNRRSQVADADAQEQISLRDDVIERLTSDQAKLQADLDKVRLFADEVKMKKNELESSIAMTSGEIREQHRKIKAMVRSISENATGSVSRSNPISGE